MASGSARACASCSARSRETTIEARIPIPDSTELAALLGPDDAYLGVLRNAAEPVHIVATRDALMVVGDDQAVGQVEQVVGQLLGIVRSEHTLNAGQVDYAARALRGGELKDLGRHLHEVVLVTDRGKTIRARTPGQRRYLQALSSNTITFALGPAGTGKTYLAMAAAIKSLKSKEVSRIILCRPAVEAGERLGFLPGDLQAKVDPYLRPLYDALFDMVDLERSERLLERGTVEVAPLAFMRGRTLNDSFIIMDEAQNTTSEQMKMFLTRLGFGSRAAVTGDITQTDLPLGKENGLVHAVRVLSQITDIAVVRLTSEDVVRHPLVQQIVEAYEGSPSGGRSR